jgi:hypothetical protein
MTPILDAISSFGLPTVAAGVLIFILVKGEFVFRYPRGGPKE